MAYLDWYLDLEECDRQRAYKLAWFLCPRRELVVARILPGAVDIVHKSARMHERRAKKIALTKLQLLQLGILEAAGQGEKLMPPTPTRGLIWYIKHLALCTLPRSSFFAAVGFLRILSNGSVSQVLALHLLLDPCHYLGFRDERDVRRTAAILRKQMYERYQSIFQANGQELEPAETPKSARPDVHPILERMILWQTACLPATYADYCAQQQRRKGPARIRELELTRAHVYTDQEQCLARAKSWPPQLGAAFESWRLPQTNPSDDDPPPDDDPWRPLDMSHWDELEESIKEKIHYKEWQEQQTQKRAKKTRGQEATFEVVVDGMVTTFLNRREHSSRKISLPASARYVEIRDRGSRATVANCHLMDPQELPQKGWKSAVKLLSGEKVHFALFPEPGRDDEGPGIAMRVKLKASPLLALLGSGSARAWQAVQGWVARARTPGRDWHEGWSALERAWLRLWAAVTASGQRIGYRPIMAGIAIAAILVGGFVLWPRPVSEASARTAIYAALPKVVQVRTHLKEAPTREEVELVAQQVEVRIIHVNGVTLPWPTLSPETAQVAAIGEGLRRFASLRPVYHNYLAQWLEIFPHVDESLSDSNLSGAIQVFEYLRHVPPYDRDKSLLFSLGELYKMRGKDDANSHRQAIAVYDDMIARGMAAGDPRPWHYAGWSWFKLHEDDRALEYYEQALSLLPPTAPTSAKILFNLALAYEAKGGLSPEDHRRLVDSNIQRALDLTLAAAQCEGDINPRVPFTLAILYTVTREPATALQYLARAVQQEPLYVVRADYEPAFEFFRNPAHEPYHTEFLDLLKQYRPHAQGRRAERVEEPFNPCIFWE